MSGLAKTLLACCLLLVCSLCQAASGPTTAAAKPRITYLQYVRDRGKTILDPLQVGGDIDAAVTAMQTLFDQAVLYAPDDPPDVLREADYYLRIARQLRSVPGGDRGDLLKYLLAHDSLAATVVFLPRGENEETGLLAMFDQLRRKRSDQVEKYATLTAAICAVHRTPLQRHINENTAAAGDPVDIFDFYSKNEANMLFGIRDVPSELLIYVVDTTASVGEMAWALKKYQGDTDVGKRFFDIKYDFNHLHTGAAKAVTSAGYTLQNILADGGVCADQAYFASEVGKSIGVPTAVANGASGEAGHSWIGFLQNNRGQGVWNFDSGRYEAYRGLRGMVLDPQARHWVPDCFVSLLAELIGVKRADRQNAVALTDTVERIIELEGLGSAIVAARKNLAERVHGTTTAPAIAPSAEAKALPAIPPPDGVIESLYRKNPRHGEVEADLKLLQEALHRSTGQVTAWFCVRDLAVINKLQMADKRHWADSLCELGGVKYPDFTFEVVAPMIATMNEVKEQDRVWTNLLELFKKRVDLVAGVRMFQAANWETHSEKEKARLCYMDVINRYANAGPFVILALQGAESILKETKREKDVVGLYKDTWEQMKVPKELAPIFRQQSNWYRVGKLYAKKLEEAGDATAAKQINAQLDAG